MFDTLVNRRFFLLRSAATIGLARTPSALPQDTASAPHDIIGAWRVDVQGAPFGAHLMLFHADGTMVSANPDAGDPGTSDSDGMGVWSNAGNRMVKEAFEEIDADRATHQFVARLRVEFTVIVEAKRFHGPAHAIIYAPDGSEKGHADVFFTATRIQCGTNSEHHA